MTNKQIEATGYFIASAILVVFLILGGIYG